MEWKVTPPPANPRVERTTEIATLNGSPLSPITHSLSWASSPDCEVVMIQTLALYRDAAQAEMLAEAIAAEWPMFAAAVRRRMGEVAQ